MTLPTGPDPDTPTVPLLTAARFAELSGSATVPTVQQLYTAQRAVEAFLRRGLAKIERTERVRVYRDRRVYPKCTPLVTVPDGYVIDGPAVLGVVAGGLDMLGRPDMLVEGYTQTAPYGYLTYTGGWDADNLPQPIEDALARETLVRMGGMSTGLSTTGATSVRNLDVAITYANGMPGGGVSAESAIALAPWVWSDWVAA